MNHLPKFTINNRTANSLFALMSSINFQLKMTNWQYLGLILALLDLFVPELVHCDHNWIFNMIYIFSRYGSEKWNLALF